jgi:hypothetical protein
MNSNEHEASLTIRRRGMATSPQIGVGCKGGGPLRIAGYFSEEHPRCLVLRLFSRHADLTSLSFRERIAVV